MCRNQLGRRNITDEQKTALIGEAYKAQKMAHGGNTQREHDESGKFTTSRQNGDLRSTKTKDVIAKQFGVGGSTVERAEQFVDGLNEAEKFSPGIKEAVLSGAIKASKKQISEIRNATEEKKREAVEAIKKGDTDTARHKNPFIFCRIFEKAFLLFGVLWELKGGCTLLHHPPPVSSVIPFVFCLCGAL